MMRRAVKNLPVVCQQNDSAEYQQADALWELFLELKTTAGDVSGPAAGDDDDDDDDEEENSRLSSVTDDTTSRDDGRQTTDIQVTSDVTFHLKINSFKVVVKQFFYLEKKLN